MTLFCLVPLLIRLCVRIILRMILLLMRIRVENLIFTLFYQQNNTSAVAQHIALVARIMPPKSTLFGSADFQFLILPLIRLVRGGIFPAIKVVLLI